MLLDQAAKDLRPRGAPRAAGGRFPPASRVGLNSRDVDRPGCRGTDRSSRGDRGAVPPAEWGRSQFGAELPLGPGHPRAPRRPLPGRRRSPSSGRDDPADLGARRRVPRTYRRSGGVAPGPAAGVGTGRSVPPVPVRGNDEFPDPEVPLIFDDSRPRDRYRRDVSSDGSPSGPDRPGPAPRPRLHEPPAPSGHDSDGRAWPHWCCSGCWPTSAPSARRRVTATPPSRPPRRPAPRRTPPDPPRSATRPRLPPPSPRPRPSPPRPPSRPRWWP